MVRLKEQLPSKMNVPIKLKKLLVVVCAVVVVGPGPPDWHLNKIKNKIFSYTRLFKKMGNSFALLCNESKSKEAERQSTVAFSLFFDSHENFNFS